MTIPVTTRSGKGSALTYTEMDANLNNLARVTSTTQEGNVQLIDSYNSTSMTRAPTANALNDAYDTLYAFATSLIKQEDVFSPGAPVTSGTHTITTIADCAIVCIEVKMTTTNEYIWHYIPMGRLVIGRDYVLDCTRYSESNHYDIVIRFTSNTSFTIVNADGYTSVVSMLKIGKLIL